MGKAVVPSQQAEQHRQATEGRVRRQSQYQRDAERHHVVRPATANRSNHDLAQYRLVRAGPDVEADRQLRQPQEHHPQDGPEQQLGPFGPA